MTSKQNLCRDLLKWIKQEFELDYFSSLESTHKPEQKKLIAPNVEKQNQFSKESILPLSPKTPKPKILESKTPEPRTPEPKTPDSKLPRTPAIAFQSIKKLVEIIDPSLEITPDTLSDQAARKKSHLWKYLTDSTKAIILCNKQSEKKVGFLRNLSTAIQIYFFPCCLLHIEEFEEGNDWPSLFSSESLKLTLMFEDDLKKFKNLLSCYRKYPQEQLLGNIPLFTLSSFKTYIEDPLQKRILWKELCQKIQSL